MGGRAVAENLAPYVNHFRRKMRQEAIRRRVRIEAAQIELRKLVRDFVRIDPGIRTIVLFGSLATGRVRSEHFDIDLAVDCTPEAYLKLVSRALDSRFDVDVIEMRTAPGWLGSTIERDGRVLYER